MDVDALLPVVRRVVRARVSDPDDAEDAVQETVARVLAASDRIQAGMAEPYAVRTARNLVATLWRDADRHRRRLPALQDPDAGEPPPDERVAAADDVRAMDRALARFGEEDRALLLAHEALGRSTVAIARGTGSTPGAVAARLHRLRARLRAEYLVALEHDPPPERRCRVVLHAVSLGDRRRQREADADAHLVECDYCRRVAAPLAQLHGGTERTAAVAVRTSADVVAARRVVRAAAAQAGLPVPGPTVVAAAVTEVVRHVLHSAGRADVVAAPLDVPRAGVRVTVRAPASSAGTRGGRAAVAGLEAHPALAGTRSAMDEFDVVARPGRGATVVMTKWVAARRP